MILEFDPDLAVTALREQYDPEFFVDGNCHHLALALFEAAVNTGQLVACIRHHIDADTHEVSLFNYSYRLYESADGRIWDIDGPDADERRVSQFCNVTAPVEDNLLSDFDWVKLQPTEEPAFAIERDACFGRAIVDEVKAKVIAASRSPATQ